MDTIIRSKNLKYEYIRRDANGEIIEVEPALNDINLEVKKGDFIALLGSNGSGKSTLAKHLNALLFPDEGSLYITGLDSSDPQNTLTIRQNSGMVFQNPDNQIICGTVEEDIGFGPENIGIESDEIWQRVEKSLKEMGLTLQRKSSPNKLSGGQKQRVAIAGVLAMEPKCIILDEATSMLDPMTRASILSIVKDLQIKKNITIIWISHYMEEVVDADFVYVMKNGKIQIQGKPAQIFAQKNIIEDCGLDLPHAAKIAHELRQRGIDLGADILTNDDLVNAVKKLIR